MALIARLKVTLSDIEPQGLRRFDLSLKITLNRLHDVISRHGMVGEPTSRAQDVKDRHAFSKRSNASVRSSVDVA